MDKTLLEKLKDVGKYYNTYADFYSLCRDAAERIEEQYKEIREIGEENIRLAEKVGQSNSKHMEVLNKLRETNDKYNLVSKNNDELLKMYAPTVKARDKLIEENIRLEAEVKEVTHANDDLIKRNIELGWDNNRLSVELNNLALAPHSDKDVAIRDDELRDQLACAALQGILSGLGWLPGSSAQAADAVAEQAYVYADAMLKAKKVRGRK